VVGVDVAGAVHHTRNGGEADAGDLRHLGGDPQLGHTLGQRDQPVGDAAEDDQQQRRKGGQRINPQRED